MEFTNEFSSAICYAKGYTNKNAVSAMVPIVSEQDIIDTYSAEDQRSCQKYAEYLKLVKVNPKMGYKKAAKILGIRQGSTRWWHTKGKKQAIPNPIKAVRKLEQCGLLPFSTENPEFDNVVRMMGVIYGDGNIDCNLNTLSFISSDFSDIETWKSDLLRIFPFAKDKINIIEGGEYGHSFCIRTFDRSIIRFFVALGTPVGDKVATTYTLPSYIFNLSSAQKIAFLDGLFAAEISVAVFRGIKGRPNSERFTNFALGMSKIDSLESEHRDFLDSVRKLSETIGIHCTPSIRKDIEQPSFRKDGNIAYCYRIFFRTHFPQIIYFNQLFALHYAIKKKQRLESEIKLAPASKFPSQKPNIFNRVEDSNGADDLSPLPNLRKTSFQSLQALLSGARV